ncbi:putative acetyltransferase At3g50280 [Silene latifolia]|uniref:putative acetyltransferase At3g50280 n=1 Tax=Silene latifolia TaxID=37657 RepID=UPI003D786BFE
MELISEYFVKPKHEVLASKNPIYLTPVDIQALRFNPTQRGLLYNYTLDQSTSSTILDIIDTLKESLSISLIHFYPLAGRLVTETFTDENACSVFIDCNKGPGARLTHVVVPGVTKLDILSPNHVPVIVKKFFEFGEEILNYDGHTRPLLAIQVTELVDGVFIGFTTNHCVVDGTSSTHFLNMLSEIFCSNNASEKLLEISRVPVFEHGPCIKLPRLRLEEIITRRRMTSPLQDRVFHFSAASMAMIKAQANKNGSILNVSSFQGLSSLIWRAITRARNLSTDQETVCCMTINARPRLDPPLSDNYFGNYISLFKVISKVDELLGHDYDWAAMRLNDGIKALDDKSIRSTLNSIAQLLSMEITTSKPNLEDVFHGPNGVLIGGSARFDIYGLEFGLGKVVVVRMGLGNKSDGKITAHPGREENGSVDLEVSLKEEHMASLEMDHKFMSFAS